VILLVLSSFPVARWSAIPAAHAQTTTATAQGTILDTSGALVPGATVTLRSESTGFVRSAVSDARGAYALPFVPVGTYTLTVSLQGFKTVSQRDLRFEIGQELTIDMVLEAAAIAEEVVVTAAAPLVQTTRSTLDTVISREQLDDLPLNGRQAASLAMLAPGVMSTGRMLDPASQSGQPRGSSEYIVDGVTNEMAVNNGFRSGAPPDAIQEFQVLTTQYQAEFGSAAGIVLNTITRSGTNQLHGRGYYFHRDEGLDARNAFATSQASFEQKQGGGWIGGPIVKDRTHYFFSYEGTSRTTIANVTGAVDPGDYEVPRTNNQWLAKVTHQLTSAHLLTARVLVDRPVEKNLGVGGLSPPELGVTLKQRDTSSVISVGSILSPRALNEVRVQYADTLTDQTTRNPDVFTIARPSSTRGKLPDVPQRIPERRIQFVDNFTLEAGSHRFKFGVDATHVTEDGFFMGSRPGIFSFSTDEPFDPANPATYPFRFQTTEGDPNFRWIVRGASAFAQDTWRLPRNLTLNVGVRFDSWDVTGMDLEPINFAPRLGIAWDPFGTHKTVVRGGFGVFYNNVMTNTSLYADFNARQRQIVIQNPSYPDPYAGGTAVPQANNTYVQLPDQPMPRSYNTTIGMQRELRTGLAVSADYVNAKGRNLVRLAETNPVLPDTLRRSDPSIGFVRAVESSGFGNYHALLVSASNRFGGIGTAGLAYTLSTAKSTNENEFSYIAQSDVDQNDSYGYSSSDRRHRFVLNGTVRLPWGLQVAALLQGETGTPFNISLGRDANGNLVADRPDLAPGARVGTDDMRNRSSFVDPGTRSGNLPRNAGRDTGFWQLDVRLAKRITLGRTRLELLVEAFNVDNHVTFGAPVSNLASSLFGRSVSADDARQVQLGVRVDF
jgi:hypothetical protein